VLFPCAERVGQTGEVTGVDLAEEMVRVTNAEAAQRGICARVRVMDAEHLDFADATFDRVLCGFGIMFFPDQVHALGEFRRVMKPDGRIAVSTWKVSQTSELDAALADLGIKRGRPPGWITEPDVLSGLLAAAGFSNVSVKVDPHSFRYADIDEYWRQARGTGMRLTLDALSAADAERLRGAMTGRVTPAASGEFHSTSTALVAVASG
jgi:SAM-dependent methyltransferase